MNTLAISALYLVAAPILGGLLTGLDRIISARMQSRVGPPLLQPFYDALKLMSKETLVVRRTQNIFVVFHLIFVIFTGILFFTGGDLLLVIFAYTLAGVFLVLGGYKSSSPYAYIGAERELLQMMAYEPMIILVAIGFYMVTKSFQVSAIFTHPAPIIGMLPGIFLGLLFILPMKFRKSPFDLSMSHHAHQEIVRGLTTEFSGSALALLEIAHWLETILILSLVGLFFPGNVPLAAGVALGTYFLAIFVDNTFARYRWQLIVKTAWLAALLGGMGNIVLLALPR